MNKGKDFWIQVLANFRNGQYLVDTLKEQDQFIRYPKVIAPLMKDGGGKMTLLDLPQVNPEEIKNFPITPLPWDSIIIDDVTRKIVFLTAFSAPKDVAVFETSLGEKKRNALEEFLIAEMNISNPRPWFEAFWGIGEKIIWHYFLNQQGNSCFKQGWRSELLFLNFVGDTTEEDSFTLEEDWKTFYDEVVDKLFGEDDNAYPRNVYFSTLCL